MKKKCIDCNKEFDAREDWHTRCSDCQRQTRSGGPPNRAGGSINRIALPPGVSGGGYASSSSAPRPAGTESSGGGLPPNADTFLNKSGYPREEIYLDWAENRARAFEGEGLTQASLRRLFNMLKQAQMRLRVDKNFEAAKITLFEFVRLVEYNNRRNVIPYAFKRFVDDHLEVIKKSPDEFSAFVEYLTSIMARMKMKQK